MSYDATDDDLPPIFFEGWDGKIDSARKNDADAVRRQGIALHYPEISVRQQRSSARRMARSLRESPELHDKRVYVKLAKKLQMYSILKSLAGTFRGMNDKERQFCEEMLAKFDKYGAEKIKWITLKQYEWVIYLGATYIHIPREQ